MNRNQKIFIIALAMPLLLYSVPYAYAATVSSTYVVSNGVPVSPQTEVDVAAYCNTGDYATGGGFYLTGVTGISSEPYPVGASPPPAWEASAYNPSSTLSHFLTVYAVCQTPITVAGIGVPEFGSLYAAIAIAAIAYFGLSLLRTRKTPKLTTPTSK